MAQSNNCLPLVIIGCSIKLSKELVVKRKIHLSGTCYLVLLRRSVLKTQLDSIMMSAPSNWTGTVVFVDVNQLVIRCKIVGFQSIFRMYHRKVNVLFKASH